MMLLQVLLGRFLFSHYFAPNARVSDLYSFSLGFYIIIAFFFTLYKFFDFKYDVSYVGFIKSTMKKVGILVFFDNNLLLTFFFVY
jgi:hypothetical protein